MEAWRLAVQTGRPVEYMNSLLWFTLVLSLCRTYLVSSLSAAGSLFCNLLAMLDFYFFGTRVQDF